MAYNSMYSGYHPQNYGQPIQNYGQTPPMVVAQQNSMQTQNTGFVPVPSEEVARNFPVAPGESVTFKNENAPYIYTKTMGFSQLDRPIFERYKLIKEEDIQPEVNPTGRDYNWKSEAEKIWSEINVLKKEIAKTTDLAKREDDYGA